MRDKLPKTKVRQTARYVMAAVAVTVLPLKAYAKQCDGEGQLRFLGTSAEGSRSVWLSATSAGAYRLDAAQGNQTVDTWSKSRRGLHLSLSPVVSNGNGGTHKLYSGDDCLLDTQNQKNGFVFPSSIVPPGITRPPSNRPLLPLTPTVPGGVTPPIATLPVTPLMPTMPGGVTPPIATLPVTPLTPTVPGGVTPPIATLPVTPLTPIMPGGVTPPIATLPEVPPGDGNAVFEKGSVARPPVSPPPCPVGRPEDPGRLGQLQDCSIHVSEDLSSELPLTAGRELVAQSDWNMWMNGSGAQLRDQRDGMHTRGNTGATAIGLDRVLTNDLVAGFQLSLIRASANSFGGDLRTDSTSYSLGPYVSYSVSPNWLIYGALGFGRESVDTRILGLNGTSEASQYSLNVQAEGQYAIGSALVRPKIQLSHTHSTGSTYQLRGSVLDNPVTINMLNQGSDYGVVQSSMEINRIFDLGNNRQVMPYIELGVYCEYARAQSGQHLTSDLTYADTSPWGGLLRAGVRSLFGKSTMASMEVGNQSLGVNNLSIWGLQLLVSHSF